MSDFNNIFWIQHKSYIFQPLASFDSALVIVVSQSVALPGSDMTINIFYCNSNMWLGPLPTLCIKLPFEGLIVTPNKKCPRTTNIRDFEFFRLYKIYNNIIILPNTWGKQGHNLSSSRVRWVFLWPECHSIKCEKLSIQLGEKKIQQNAIYGVKLS